MGLLYPNIKIFVRLYQQKVLYFCRILRFFYNIIYLQKHTKVTLFWYKCNTIKCFLHNQGNLIYFRLMSIVHMVFLELLVRAIVESAFFRVQIIGVVFLVLIVSFLEKFNLLCNLISCLSVRHKELRQNICYSWVIILCKRAVSVSCGFNFPPVLPAKYFLQDLLLKFYWNVWNFISIRVRFSHLVYD